LYWIFTLAMLVASAAIPSAFPHMRPDFMHTVLSLAFIPHVSPDTGLIMPALGQGWTLNFEVFFYLLFALVLLLPAPRRLPAIAATLLALPVLGLFLLTPAVPVTTLLSPLLVEFLGGIVIARLVIGGVRLPQAWCWLCIGVGVAALCVASPRADDDAARLLEYGVPAFLIVAGAVAAECRGTLRIGTLPRLLGDASYSIYLSHTFVISAVGKVWPSWSPRWAFLIAATLCSVPVGIAVYRLLERPMLAVLRGRRAAAPVLPLLSNGGSRVRQA
jgi:exopolysaccharide production protein ExoZ